MRTLATVFALIALIATIVAVRFWSQLQTTREQETQIQLRLTDMERAQNLPASVPAPASVTSTASTDAAAPPATDRTPSVEPERKTASAPLSTRQLVRDQEFRSARRVQVRAAIATNYAGVASDLGLTEQEANELFDLITNQQINAMDTAVGAGATNEERQQAARTQREQRQQHEAALQNLLGTRYSQWQDFQKTMPARQRVSQLGVMLASSGQALSETQSKSLTALLIADRKRQTAELGGRVYPTERIAILDYMEQNLKATEANNRQLLNTAASYLTAQQLDRLRRLFDQELAASRASIRMQRAQLEASTAPAMPAAAGQ